MMNTSLIRPINRYIVYSSVSKVKSTPSLIRQYVKLQGRNSAPMSFFQNGRVKILSRSTVINSFNDEIVFFSKNYSLDSNNKTRLMDFEMQFSSDIFNILKIRFYTYFILRQFDSSFYLGEFVYATKQVMEIITHLLSEARFSDLDGLLTKECKEEVEKNVKTLQPSKRMSLAIKAEDILKATPCGIDLIRGEENKEKVFAQIMVIYHSLRGIKQYVHPSLVELGKYSFENYMVYNARFIRELTPGVEDQWTINAINVFRPKDFQNDSF